MNTQSPALLSLCLALSLAVMTGCQSPKPGGTAGPSQPPKPSALCKIHDLDGPAIPATFSGTLNKTHKTRAANHVVQVNSVETACCQTFDRVVFDFEGIRLPPDYTVEYVTGPVSSCGSGQNIPVAGNAKLRIRFKTSQAHTDAGKPTITNRNRKLNCPNLRQLVVTCDFEGEVEVVLGLNSKKPYRVVELLNDSKLVIDVKH
jgi:hypothetical protein